MLTVTPPLISSPESNVIGVAGLTYFLTSPFNTMVTRGRPSSSNSEMVAVERRVRCSRFSTFSRLRLGRRALDGLR